MITALVTVVVLAGSARTDDSADDECGSLPSGFSAKKVDVGDAVMHAVVGGDGPAVVLLHGFPETWYTWRGVMAALGETHRVIVPDLLGVGCSSLASRYDADTMARAVHDVIRSEGVDRVAVVGHDTGGWVAYSYARQFRDGISHLVLSGTAIPGFGLEDLLDFRTPGQGLPHLAFFQVPDVPEMLIAGREREYFGDFVTSDAMHRSGVIDVYARSYARPGRLTAALGQYRAIYDDATANRRGAAPTLDVPTMALSGPEGVALSADGLRRVARDVTEVAIPGAGHYVQEDAPAEVAAALARFIP
ncbi:alpha/beta fold hydrolase [Mycolicibacterium sediminis]|uniref:alpha/beta fold hydrolase n=1 Tax=Mycolicibacterium sediminis TaxID=1286180 RepID=UPI0013D556B4|nr:alpha/beta hydrolase [Mycolicibacterium sediminis]